MALLLTINVVGDKTEGHIALLNVDKRSTWMEDTPVKDWILMLPPATLRNGRTPSNTFSTFSTCDKHFGHITTVAMVA